ncbi:MAG TPA: histone deacetylase [Terriglobales bacterium]|nr:histone deacetylase [Terriglobales bacterium]
MSRPRLFYTDHYELPLPLGHRFPIEKYRLLREKLEADAAFSLEPAPLADIATIGKTHDPAYVRAFLEGGLDAAAMRRIGFPWSEGLVRRSLASIGSTLAATDEALAHGWSGSLAGGTHHAFRAEGSGYCVFNDIAVAIDSLRASGRIHRAAVVDLDVHQGDGTAEIFRGDQDVLTLSVHCKENFPLRKQQSRIDIELDAGTGDDAYLDTLARVLLEVEAFHPEIIYYQSGVDGLAEDRLGKLDLTLEGLKRRDMQLMQLARDVNVPLVITLGGGYARPITLTAEAHANTFRTAREVLCFT